jgi:hypothetical protein
MIEGDEVVLSDGNGPDLVGRVVLWNGFVTIKTKVGTRYEHTWREMGFTVSERMSISKEE